MFGIAALTLFGIGALVASGRSIKLAPELPTKITSRLDKLWQVAHSSLREKKYLRAEKALLTILRVDERNATAYNRLGILYAKQRAYDDAIECFEIAQSLEPSASSLHNVGLIYYETGQYDKAALAFEQALSMEDNHPARYIAYAKVQEKLGNNKKMIESLETALEIESNTQTLTILADAYDRTGQEELATKLRKKLEKMVVPANVPKKIQQPRRVIM
jgi:tetratricopeptide (TPR) repeat protein